MLKDYDLISCENFNPHKIQQLKSKGKSSFYVCNDFCSLDNETSKKMDEQVKEAWIYQWTFSYPVQPPMMKRQLVYGRKPSDLAKALKKIVEVNGLNDTHKLNIFVCNLSYDWHYFKDFLEEEFGCKGEVLAIGTHKIITYTICGLCFRCTLKLTQKGLDDWSKEMGTKHRKLKGTIDYDVTRYQEGTKLTKKDWKYMFYDVVVLDECIKKQLEKFNDDMVSIPLTLTGYVRRECYKHFKEDKFYKNEFKQTALSPELYKYCRLEYAGGVTHGNRFFMERTVKIENILKERGGKWFIKHRDFASHFPSQQVTGYAPSSEFTLYYDSEDCISKMDWNKLAGICNKKCVLVAIIISDLTLKRGVTLPIAQVSKFREGEIKQDGVDKLTMIEDNGRILKMTSGASVVVMNEYDLKWLKKQYDFKYEIKKVFTARRGRYPKWLTDTVMDFFYKKSYHKMIESILKEQGVSKESREYVENHLDLMISKSLLNAIYGCTASRIIRDCFYVDNDGFWRIKEPSKKEVEEELKKYYNNVKSFMPYQLGCWTTSEAKDELLTFVELIGYENFIYADTDSIFYISNDEIEAKIERKNKEFRDIDDANGWFVEVNGKKVYFNQFELEKEEIVSFRFLHAKCYAYEVIKRDEKTGESHRELEVTIAGVSEFGRNNTTRVKELGSIDNLKGDGSTKFINCGGTKIEYLNRKIKTVYIDGYKTEVAGAAIISNTDKTIHDALYYSDNFIDWEVSEIGI